MRQACRLVLTNGKHKKLTLKEMKKGGKQREKQKRMENKGKKRES